MTRRLAATRPARLALAAATLVATAGAGEARTLQQQLEAACSVDIARLCPGLTAASEAVKACLLHRRPEVDAECLRLIDASE